MKVSSILLALGVLVAGCGEIESEMGEVVESTGVGQTLLSAREAFETRIIPNAFIPDGRADEPPDSELEITHYEAKDGNLVAYVTPDPGDGEKHPAVLWAHGGFGGIGSWLWEEAPKDNDQSVRAFLDAGIVTMCPSWRGENDNPGRFELFYGEVDDLLDALAYLKSLPYVDPERIYLAGHSTGGTLALLASVSTDQFRAVFSFGGAPNLARLLKDGQGYGNTPYQYLVIDESFYRSAINFVDAISTPTFYFAGEEESFYAADALKMQAKAKKFNVPFKAYIIKRGTHFNILQPLMKRIAKKILEDDQPACTIGFKRSELKVR